MSIALAACESDPVPAICPDVEVGELVLTEIRGTQTGANSYPLFFEIYNGTDRELDVAGFHLVIATQDHGSEADVIVRRHLPVAAGAYFTIAPVADTLLPAQVDYGGLVDFVGASAAVFPRGDVTLVACGDVIDRVVYDELPEVGTRSLMTMPPDAERNDDAGAWCTDAIVPEDATTELGAPGTPGGSNRCGG